MTLSKRTRTHRPAIEPIQTSYINLPDRSRTPIRRRPSPLSRAIRIGPHRSASGSSDSEGLQDDGEQPIYMTQLGKLRISDCDSPVAPELTTPSGTRWTVARQPHPTPVSAVAKNPDLAPPIIEVRATGNNIQGTENNEASTPITTNAAHLSLHAQPPSNRRRSAPCCGASIRQLRFQKYREDLWKLGARAFGHAEDADAFVMPVQLRRPALSDGEATLSPLSPPSGRLNVRAVVYSKKRATIGLKREFDLDALRATIPDPLPSPRSPNFDREALLSTIGARLSPTPTSINKGCNTRTEDPKVERFYPGAVAVPMHFQYARAQLPALAAIMLSDQVRLGDTIGLPVPHSRAWLETVAFVYTGEEELLTEQVKENIWYLGGKI